MEDTEFKLRDYYENKNIESLDELDLNLSAVGSDNSFAGGGEMSEAEMYQAANKKPDPAMMGLQGAASGAAAGAAFGPWGAAVGGVVGGATGVVKGIAGGKEFERQMSTARVSDNNADRAEDTESGMGSVIGGSKIGFSNSYAEGGQIGLPNSLEDGGPNVFNEGGTHEENPLGGIPQGTGPNGKPNSVEEGEVSFMYEGKKLIISNRI